MAKGTLIFISFLCILAALLVGVNVGKNISKQANNTSIRQLADLNASPQPTLPPSPSPSPIIILTPTTLPSPTVSSKSKVKGTSAYKDNTCGFQLVFPSAYLSQKTENNQSVIFTDPDDQSQAIAISCTAYIPGLTAIPRPPVTSDKIEAITLGGVAATLYHDQNENGSPRDEVIVKNPVNNLEIIIAGYGETFQTAVKSFKFL